MKEPKETKGPVLEEKALLTVREASDVLHLSYRKLFALTEQENVPFLAMYKTRKLIIKDELIRYLKQPGAEEALKKKWEQR